MSQENVEIVTRAIDTFNRREIDAFGTPEFELFPSTVWDGRGRQSLLDGVCAISEPKRVHHSIDIYPMQNRAQAGLSAGHHKQRSSGAQLKTGRGSRTSLRVSPIRGYRPGSLIPDACHGPRVRDTGRAMSEESASPDLVELTREVFEAVNRGDLDASLSFYRPDVAWDGSSLGIGTFEGAVAFRRFVEDWVAAYDELKFELEEIVDLGNGVVFKVHHQTGRPVGSTGYVRQRHAWVIVWELGLIVQGLRRYRRGPCCGRAACEPLGARPRVPRTRSRRALILTTCDDRAMRYVRLFSGDDGQALFEDLEFTFVPRDFAPPAPLVNVSEPVGASAFMMIRLPAGWKDAAHPAPARQFMMVLAGSAEVAAGGETRLLSTGDVILVEDITGPGHGTTALEDLLVAVVRL